MKHLIYILLLIPPLVTAQNQVRIDSLELRMKNATLDTARIQALIDISHYYNSTNYAKAAEYLREARELAIKKGLKKWQASADGSLATIFLDMGSYKNASIHYFNALKFYEDVNDTSGIVSTCNNLGALHDRLKEFDKALVYYMRGLTLLTRLKPALQKSSLPFLYNNIANIYETKNDFESAKQYYEKALALAIQQDDKRLQGTAYNNLGKLYFTGLKDEVIALKYLLKGLHIREQLGDEGSIAKSLNILAIFYLDRKDYAAARASCLRALELGEKTGALSIQIWAYTTLSRLEEQQGNHQAALDAFKVLKKLNDSIQTQLASSEITRLQLQYDFEKAEKAREDELQKSRFRYLVIIAVLAVSLIIALLIMIIVRNRAKQTELKRQNLLQDVEIKNKELTTNVMYLMRKNELINSVAERLLKVQDNIKPENHKVLHDIILGLQKEADNDSWKEFELRFQQVHNEFYINLRQLYPNLSPADEKLCAFLRLNMSSKEIAAVTQQSIKSVEVARARLRKKLNLTNTASNLVTHLSNI